MLNTSQAIEHILLSLDQNWFNFNKTIEAHPAYHFFW
jgi:hypothetical protein